MYKSRLPKVAAELALRADLSAKASAELVAAKAKDRVPVETGRLRDAIHVAEGDTPGEQYVVAGDSTAFYGHIVEHGSVNAPPHPFLIPAAEESRTEIQGIVRETGRGL